MATQFAVDLVFKSQGEQKIKSITNQLRGLSGAGQQAAAGTTQAANGIKRTGRAAASATANVQRFGIAFRSVLGPLVAVTGAITFFSRSLKTLGDRQADVAALQNGLKGLTTNGGAALDSLLESADRLGKATLFNDEEFRKAFKLLTSFRTIGVSTYERVATVGADMAQVLGQDVNSVLLQVAKALEAPEVGLTALQRSGTRFTEQQKEQVKAMVAAGQTAEAQAFILSELERQYGGAAKAAGSAGFAGAMDSLGESFRDFQETIGRVIEPLATGFVKALTASIEWMNAGYQVVLKLIGAFSPLGELLDSLGINWENFGKAAEFGGKVVSIVANDVAYLVNQMAQAVADVLKGLFSGIGQFFSGIVDSSAQGMKGVVQNVVNGIRAIRNAIASLINAAPPAMLSKLLGFDVGKTLTAPLGGVASGIEAAFNYGSSVVQRAGSLDFGGGGGGFSDIRGGGAPGTAEGGGGAGKTKAQNDELKKQQEELKRIQDAYDRIFESIDKSGMSMEKQLEDQQRLNALLMEGFDSKAAQEQVAFERQIKDLQFERATKLQELKGIENITQQQIQTGESEINRIYDERIQKAFALNQAKKEGNDLLDQAAEKSRAIQAQEQMLQSLYDGIGSTIANGIGSAIDAVANGTEDLGKTLQKLGQQILAQVGKMLIFYALAQAFGALAGPGGGGSLLGGIAKGFGFQFKAGGGPIQPGGSYVVGEKGPELLQMNADGTGYVNSTNSEAMSRYRPGRGPGGSVGSASSGDVSGDASGQTIDVAYTVERINERNYVTEEAFRAGMNQAAKKGAEGGYAKTMGSMRNSRSTRARLGMG